PPAAEPGQDLAEEAGEDEARRPHEGDDRRPASLRGQAQDRWGDPAPGRQVRPGQAHRPGKEEEVRADEDKLEALLGEIAADSLRKKESRDQYRERLEVLRDIITVHIDAIVEEDN